MNGWLIVGAAAVGLVVVWRLWFRWFSRRPLSDTDTYAVAVDSALDSASGRPAPVGAEPGDPSPVTPSATAPPRPADRPEHPARRPVAGSTDRPAPVAPAATAAAPTIPRQRGAGDPRVTGRPVVVSGGPDGDPAEEQPSRRNSGRPAPSPPTG